MSKTKGILLSAPELFVQSFKKLWKGGGEEEESPKHGKWDLATLETEASKLHVINLVLRVASEGEWFKNG